MVKLNIKIVIVLVLIAIGCSTSDKNSGSNDLSAKSEMRADIDVANEIQKLIHTDYNGEIKGTNNIYGEYERSKSSRSISSRTFQDEAWIERGPGNVGGRMRSIIIDRNDPTGETWIAGSASGGIWRTTNSGTNWENLTSGLSFLSFVTLAQSESNPDIIYAGTGEGAFGASITSPNGAGIFKSTDGGTTWSVLASTTPENSINFQNTNRLIVNPLNPDEVYAATSNGPFQDFISGVQKTTDGGVSWTEIFTADARVQQIVASPDDFNRMYISLIIRGVYYSEDGGDTFTKSNLDDIVSAAGGDLERSEIAIAPTNPDVIYASCGYRSRSGSGLFVSKDAGVSWSEVDDEENGLLDYLVQGEYNNCIAVNPFDETEVFWGGVVLYKANVDLGTATSAGRNFLSLLELGTEDFLDFVSFNNGTNAGGRLAIADPINTPSIEVRFGPGVTQKGHRFTVPIGSTAGVPDEDYTYQDYVDVPFEVWDIESNTQLMVSFRDQEDDGVFNLNLRDPDDEELRDNREYFYIHSTEYDANNPSSAITVDGGQEVNQYIFFWPTLAEGASWPDDVVESNLRINFGEVTFQESLIEPITTNLISDPTHPDHHVLVTLEMNETDFRLITGNDGGVAFTDNKGLSFSTTEIGLNTSQFYSATKRPGFDIYFGGTQDNGVLLSPNQSTAASPYTESNVPNTFADGFEVVWNQNNPSIIIASNQQNNIFKSTDEGSSWAFSIEGLDDAGFSNASAPFFTKVAGSQATNNIYAVSDNGVWKSVLAENWSLVDMTSFSGWGGFLDVEVSPVDKNLVWTGGGLSDTRDIFLSTDAGSSFSAVSKFDEPLGNITSIIPSSNDANSAFLVFSQRGTAKILKTTNLGDSWTDLTQFTNGTSQNGYPDVSTYSVLEFPDGQRIWAGTDLGIVESLDGGSTWSLYEGNLPNVMVWDLKVIDGQVIAATHGRGIWSIDLGLDYTNLEEFVLGVDDRSLEYRIYPNPVDNIAQLSLNGELYFGSVSIRSLSGKLIQETKVSNGEINVEGLESGVYLINGQTSDGDIVTARLIKK